MSLKYRDSQGTETPVAGLNGTSGELVPSVALQQSGTESVTSVPANSWISTHITFTTPMPDADYVVVADENSNGYIAVDILNKTVNGFTAFIYNRADSDIASATVTWQAFKLMTDTVHEADAAHIAQNTANFAPAFSELTSYAVGDYVTYNNMLYRCTTAHTAGVWVAGHFTQVTVGGRLKSLETVVPSTASSSNKLITADYLATVIIVPNTELAVHTSSNNVIEIIGMANEDSILLDTVIVVGFGGNMHHYDRGNVTPTVTAVYDSDTNTYDISVTVVDATFIARVTSNRGVTIS